jgi:hypothetical protein
VCVLVCVTKAQAARAKVYVNCSHASPMTVVAKESGASAARHDVSYDSS